MDPETHRCDTEDFQNRDACVSCFPEGSRKLLNPFLWLIKHQWLIALVTSVPLTVAAKYRLVSSVPQHYVSALDWSELRSGCQRSLAGDGDSVGDLVVGAIA